MAPGVLALAAAVAVLAAPPAQKIPRITHAEAPRPAPLALAGGEDVVALCARLTPPERLRPSGDRVDQGERLGAHAAAREEAIVGRYALTVPGAQLAFSPYDGPEHTLSVAEPAAFTLEGGRGMPGTDAAKVKREPAVIRIWAAEDRALPVDLDAAGARRILAAQRTGRLMLRLVFDLPDDATCGTDVRGRHFTLAIEPVEWTWLDGDAVLARGGVGRDRPALSVAQGAEPVVDVGEPIAGPSEAKRAVLAHRAELLACYQGALQHDPGLDGLVVIDLGPRVEVAGDSTGSAELTGCVQRSLAPLAAAARSTVPIRFELAAPGTSARAIAIPAAGAAEPETKGVGE
jgi:hypothetical protein